MSKLFGEKDFNDTFAPLFKRSGFFVLLVIKNWS